VPVNDYVHENEDHSPRKLASRIGERHGTTPLMTYPLGLSENEDHSPRKARVPYRGTARDNTAHDVSPRIVDDWVSSDD